MPKDRLTFASIHRACVALALLAATTAAGCRHGRPEVPPERPYIMPGAAGGAGGAAPHVGFSSEPPPAGNAYGTAAAISQGLPGSAEAPGSPSFSTQPPPYSQPGAVGGPPEPEPLQDMPGPGSASSPGALRPGVMGVQGAPPSPY